MSDVTRLNRLFPEDIVEKMLELQKLPTTRIGKPELGYVDVIQMKHVDRSWETMLSDCLFRLTGFSVFFSALAHRCQYYWTTEVPTAGAAILNDKFLIFLNPVFMIDYLEKGSYQTFVLYHEVCHVFYHHGPRAIDGGFDFKIFNEAADFYIHSSSSAMIEEKRTRGVNVEMIPKDVFPLCYDKKYDGMTEEEIYKDLIEQAENQDGANGGGDGSGEAFDDVPYVLGDGSSGDPSKVAEQAVAKAIAGAKAAAETMNSGQEIGDAEAGLIRRFVEMSQPKVDWRDEFNDFFERTRDVRPTYAHYSRRSTDHVIFPSKEGEKINVFFGTDTSGSNINGIKYALGEMASIMKTFGDWKLTIATCDTKAEVMGMYSSENDDVFPVDGIDIQGFGGTLMSPMVELAQSTDEAAGEEPYNVIVILTDGYINHGDITDVYDGEIPLIVLITPDGAIPDHLKDTVNVIKITD